MKQITPPRLFLLLFACVLSVNVSAQENHHGGLTAEELKQANNPLASIKTLNIHNYVIPRLYASQGLTINNLNLRYAQPIGRVFLRASMPFVTSTRVGAGPVTGFGDFTLFGMYTFPHISEGAILGIGPMVVMPSGSHGFGQGKWQAGISAVAFFSKSPVVQFGTLLQWQTSFANQGDGHHPNVNLLTPQLFVMWQVGGGTYLRSTGIWSFNLKNGDYNVPLGLGIGKVVKSGRLLFNIFAEPQFSVLAKGVGQPKAQIFVGINTQF